MNQSLWLFGIGFFLGLILGRSNPAPEQPTHHKPAECPCVEYETADIDVGEAWVKVEYAE